MSKEKSVVYENLQRMLEKGLITQEWYEIEMELQESLERK